MKKVFLSLAVIVFANIIPAPAQSANDSTFILRNDLYYQYLDIRNNTDKFKEADYKNLMGILEKIVLSDNRLLDTIEAKSKLYKGYQQHLDDLNFEKESLTRERDSTASINFYLLIAAGVSFLLFLIFLVLFIIKYAKSKKLRGLLSLENDDIRKIETVLNNVMTELEKNQKETKDVLEKTRKEKEYSDTLIRERELQLASVKDELAKSTANDEKIIQLNNKITLLEKEIPVLQNTLIEKESLLLKENEARNFCIAEYERKIEGMRSEIAGLETQIVKREETDKECEKRTGLANQEIQDLKNALLEKEKQFDEFRNQTVRDEDYFRKLGEIDLSIIKLEKLNGLKQKGILTEDECEVIRRKFLSEF
jgi:hypothetical protein